MTTNKSDSEVFDFFANMKNMEIGGAIKSMEKMMMVDGALIILLQENQR
jgi:hypothetical protein